VTRTQPSRSAIDRVVFALVTRGWGDETFSGYRGRMRADLVDLPPEILESLKLIDSKATGLLTHVSLMIAGLGLVAPLVAAHEFEVGVLVFEIGVYLLIAIGCLRCLSIFHHRQFDVPADQLLQLVEHELILRRELYSLCIRASIVFTLLVFLTLPVLYFWKPGINP
jgi:hypothetical protein